MITPLLYKVYRALRRGWKRLTPEAKQAVRNFVASQKTSQGYLNAGGREDAYYQQFGEVLEAVFSPIRLPFVQFSLTVPESREKDSVYGRFFDFLEKEMRLARPKEMDMRMPDVMTTNAVCCILAVEYQMGHESNMEYVEWLLQRQDETGGFYASEQAPLPDLLSTAVALFTLHLIGVKAEKASQFIQAHLLDNGGFAPTLYDDYSDVEYVFYGLLALGN